MSFPVVTLHYIQCYNIILGQFCMELMIAYCMCRLIYFLIQTKSRCSSQVFLVTKFITEYTLLKNIRLGSGRCLTRLLLSQQDCVYSFYSHLALHISPFVKLLHFCNFCARSHCFPSEVLYSYYCHHSYHLQCHLRQLTQQFQQLGYVIQQLLVA